MSDRWRASSRLRPRVQPEVLLYTNTLQNWDPPHDTTPIDAPLRQEMFEAILADFTGKGGHIIVD